MLLFNKKAMFHSSSVKLPARKVQRECIFPFILNTDGDLKSPGYEVTGMPIIFQRLKVNFMKVVLLLTKKKMHFKNRM